MEFVEEARKRIAEEERVKRIQDEKEKRLKKEQEAASAAAVQEQMIMLESERMCIELEARQLVIEREAQRVAAEKEAAIAAEMERLRNRTALEKLQDDFEELKKQMELMKKPVEVKMVKVAKPVIKKETLKESWEALLEWQHWKKLYDDACKAWSVHERDILMNKDLFKYGFSGKVDGIIQEAYPLSQVSAELQKTQDELNALQSRYNVHKSAYQKAMKDTQEAKQNHMTIFHSRNHPDFMTLSSRGFMVLDEEKRTPILAELQKKIDICLAVEAQMKIVAEKEDADWKENKEKDKLNEKIRYLTPLKTSYKNVVKSFEFITCYNEHYTKAAWDAKIVTGMDDLEAAWKQTFDLIVAARSA